MNIQTINNLLGRIGLYVHASRETSSLRAWLNSTTPCDDSVASIEVSLGGFHLGGRLKVSEDSEAPITASIGLGPLRIFLGTEHRFARTLVKAIAPVLARDFYKHAAGEFGVEFYTCDGSWVLRGGFNSPDDGHWPNKRAFYIDLKDLLLGKAVYTEGAGQPVTRTIHLAEGAYELRLTPLDSTWKRPRWPWAAKAHRYSWEVVRGADGRTGLPVPGKGENSYDCDEDAISGGTFRASNPDDAAGQIVGDVMHDRARRASPTWMPETAANAAA